MSETPPTPPPLPQVPPGAAFPPPVPAAAASPPARQSFGEQAARFSLYTPLVAIFIGCLGRGGDQPGVAMAMGWINLVLIVAGFVLGLVALVSMRFYGRQRILVRALVGVIANGLFLAAAVSILLPAMAAKRVRDQVVGGWRVESQAGSGAAPARNDIHLSRDGTFRMTGIDGAGRVVVSASGTWRIDRNRTLGFEVGRVDAGDPSMAGQTIGLGTVKAVNGDRMVLETDKGDEVLRRLP